MFKYLLSLMLCSMVLFANVLGQSLYFDGVNQNHVDISSNGPMSTIQNNQSYTIEAWVRRGYVTHISTQPERIFSKDNVFGFIVGSDKFGGSIGASSYNQSAYPADTLWHHLAFVRDYPSRLLKYFIDGNLTFSSVDNSTSISNNNSMVCIGARNNGIGIYEMWKGNINWLRVSNSARYSSTFTPATTHTTDINTIALYPFNEGSGTVLHDISGNGYNGTITGATWTTNTYVPKNLVAYYPFNGNASDVSGNNINGTISGAQLTADRFGVANAAYEFNGGGQKITIPHSVALNPNSTGFSISLWVYVYTDFTVGDIVRKSSDQNNDNYGIRYHDPIAYPVYGTGFSTKRSMVDYTARILPSPSKNQWHHLVATHDGTKLKIFLDNVLTGTSADIPTPNTVYSNTDPLQIGSGNYSFKGKIDDIRIYNDALSQVEIDTLYHEGGWQIDTKYGLVAYYPFNGNADDESGNGYNGTLVNNTSFVNGVKGQGCKLVSTGSYMDAAGGHILLPSSLTTTLDSAPSLSISMWVNEESISFGEGESYISFGNDVSGTIKIEHDRTDLCFGVGIDNSKIRIPYDPNLRNRFVHYVLVFESGVCKGFVDGKLIGSSAQVKKIVGTNAAFVRHWWANGGSTSTRFNGSVDEVRIYDYALLQSEVDTLYHEGGIVGMDATLVTEIPGSYNLSQNFPNPFNPSTSIKYSVPIESSVKLVVFNTLGEIVKELVSEVKATGNYEVNFNASHLSSGIYFYSITAQPLNGGEGFRSVKKLVLVK